MEWQRIEITLPPELRQPDQQLGLVVQGQEPVYQVFVNGELIGAFGQLQHPSRPDGFTGHLQDSCRSGY
jgi:hypothetical protein